MRCLGEITKLLYDGSGNATDIQYPDGKTASYQYDALNRLKKVTDAANRTIRYEWTPTGQRRTTATQQSH